MRLQCNSQARFGRIIMVQVNENNSYSEIKRENSTRIEIHYNNKTHTHNTPDKPSQQKHRQHKGYITLNGTCSGSNHKGKVPSQYTERLIHHQLQGRSINITPRTTFSSLFSGPTDLAAVLLPALRRELPDLSGPPKHPVQRYHSRGRQPSAQLSYKNGCARLSYFLKLRRVSSIIIFLWPDTRKCLPRHLNANLSFFIKRYY